jgi:hypothetical protein
VCIRLLSEVLGNEQAEMPLHEECLIINQKTVCEVLLNPLDNDSFNHILMTDEANFRLCGNVSFQNCCSRATDNPCDIHQKPLHSEKVIVWYGVASFGVTGPCFFEDEAGRAVTVNSTCYTEMLCTFLEPELQRRGVETQTLWFQQDRATAHTVRTAMRLLNEMFPARVISQRVNIEWPGRYPISTLATSSSGDISTARCAKRNQGQLWT